MKFEITNEVLMTLFYMFSTDHDMSSICIIYQYVCDFGIWKISLLIEFIFIIVYCDSQKSGLIYE